MGSRAQLLRDIRNRATYRTTEVQRRALLYIARNEGLEQTIRHRAQLQLNALPTEGRPTRISDRCNETRRGRGVLSKFGLARHQFRLDALAGLIPGVKKSSW